MTYEIVVEQVPAELIAAVRVLVPVGGVATAWGPALDKVWAYLRANPHVPREHNLFLYHHPAQAGEPITADFGVQVAQRFEPAGEVRCVETPAGEVARAVHMGPYDRLGDAHAAIGVLVRRQCPYDRRSFVGSIRPLDGRPGPARDHDHLFAGLIHPVAPAGAS